MWELVKNILKAFLEIKGMGGIIDAPEYENLNIIQLVGEENNFDNI